MIIVMVEGVMECVLRELLLLGGVMGVLFFFIVFGIDWFWVL
jgi:hypothetical protein